MAVAAIITARAVAPTAIPIGSPIEGATDATNGVGDGDGMRTESKFAKADDRAKPFENCCPPTTLPITIYSPFVHVTL